MTKPERQQPKPAAPTADFITVTPEMAVDWLTRNDVNRNLRVYDVAKYIRDIEAGHWTYSNDAVCLTTDGLLLNGQHRLTAIYESGQPAVLLVAQGMPEASMINMDTGKPRTAADVLKMAGEKNAHALAALARVCAVIEDGRVYSDSRNQQLSRSETREFIEANPLLRHITEYVSGIKTHIDCKPSAIGAAYWMIQSVNGTSLAEYYIDQLASRQNEPSGSAVLAIDSRLRTIRREGTQHTQREFIRLLVRGWNYYAEDKRTSSILMSSRSEFRLPEVKRWARGDSLTITGGAA